MGLCERQGRKQTDHVWFGFTGEDLVGMQQFFLHK